MRATRCPNFNERIMLSSCFRAESAGVLAGHTKRGFALSTPQSSSRRFACEPKGPVVGRQLKIWFTSMGGPPRPAHFLFSDPYVHLTQASQQLERSLEELIDPICRAHGVELVDVRYLREPGGAVIRVIIDREVPGLDVGSGVSLEDCTAVSRDASSALDVHQDLMPSGAYRLEVSSPGLERPLVKLSDFERFAGREVKLKTRTPIEKQRRFRGTLRGVVDERVELDENGKVVRIPHEDIAQANLVYRFSN
jgi:ribosome maturation factor RimP